MTSPAFAPIVVRAASRVTLAAALLALVACGLTTLFQSSFNSQQTYAPPAATQLVGTMQLISGDSGRIEVEAGGGTGPSENVLRISRGVPVPNTNPGTPASVVQGTLAQTFPDGNYSFVGVFDIGQGSSASPRWSSTPSRRGRTKRGSSSNRTQFPARSGSVRCQGS